MLVGFMFTPVCPYVCHRDGFTFVIDGVLGGKHPAPPSSTIFHGLALFFVPRYTDAFQS